MAGYCSFLVCGFLLLCLGVAVYSQSKGQWQVVFKIPFGKRPTGYNSIMQFWESAGSYNDASVAARTDFSSTSEIYKSSILDNWGRHSISAVKVSAYKNNQEQAYIVFDATGKDKNNWMDCGKVQSTTYIDLTLQSKNFCGFHANTDTTKRQVFVNQYYNGCDDDRGWFMLKDYDATSECTQWDVIANAPYFYYSADSTGINWKTGNRQTADSLVVSVQGWKLLLKAGQGQSVSPASSVYDLWTGTYSLNDGDSNALSVAAGTKTLKSSIVDQWSNYYISAVRVSMFVGGLEKAYAVFDANGADKNSWFDKSRILYSSWNDLSTSVATNFFSIAGDDSIQRRFFMQRNYGGCPADEGWMVAVERSSSGCGWELRSSSRPFFLYSDASSSKLEDSMSIAEVFAISVDIDDCLPNPCQNGAACTDEGLTFRCTCTGDWIGNTCSDRNGGFSNWSAWGSCSVTCETGTTTRSRTCTNPTPVGTGASCTGSTTETTDCTMPMCPINGQWASWGSWGVCSVTCETGMWSRTRTCTNPAPQYGGTDCSGSDVSTGTCTLPNCPIDGVWTSWSRWGTCSVTCGGGSQESTRSCTNPAPQYGGASCTGADLQTQKCNTQVCIIDGAWSSWGKWGACSVTCGGGQYSRSRTCTNPAPANGGLPCAGDSSSYDNCNNPACPTASSGTYVQKCPSSWFTCQSGSVSCIDSAFACDCKKDCGDGSDETEGYAKCDPALVSACKSAAPDSRKISAMILVSCAFIALVLLF